MAANRIILLVPEPIFVVPLVLQLRWCVVCAERSTARHLLEDVTVFVASPPIPLPLVLVFVSLLLLPLRLARNVVVVRLPIESHLLVEGPPVPVHYHLVVGELSNERDLLGDVYVFVSPPVPIRLLPLVVFVLLGFRQHVLSE